MKTKVTITLDEYEAELFRQAVVLAGGLIRKDEPSRQRQRFFLSWAIIAVSRAVIEGGGMPCPLAVQMRFENPKQTAMRIAEELPDQDPIQAWDEFRRWNGPDRWGN